ncbi:hypothetical protein, partial [Burkholderia sp. SIMBA_024]|uniref:hypothetical protein n=1 Tax=Burkholderia sp. SIMBA_024 TaxID=3085768 RepID=UPI00397B2EE8
ALPQWIEQRVKAEQYESISLACTLSDAAMAACDEHREFHPESASLAVAMVHASHAGKDLTEKQLRNVCKALISDICSGTAS